MAGSRRSGWSVPGGFNDYQRDAWRVPDGDEPSSSRNNRRVPEGNDPNPGCHGGDASVTRCDGNCNWIKAPLVGPPSVHMDGCYHSQLPDPNPQDENRAVISFIQPEDMINFSVAEMKLDQVGRIVRVFQFDLTRHIPNVGVIFRMDRYCYVSRLSKFIPL